MTTSPTSLRIRAHELAPRLGDLVANCEAISEAVEDASNAGVDLLVLPELATCGYYFEDRAEAMDSAIDPGADVFSQWQRVMRPGMVVVVGFAERDGSSLFNSAAVLDREQRFTTYRKTHLWDFEKELFTPGDLAPSVVDTPVGRVGTLICYDLEFPEMPRLLALQGADMITVPTNWPLLDRPAGEHPPEVVQAMAAARASAVTVVCCDRGGPERGHAWTEGSAVVSHQGWLVGSRDDSGRVEAEIRLDPARHGIGSRNDVRTDRRPELYESLTSVQGRTTSK